MKVSHYKNVTLISVYEKMHSFPGNTYNTSQTLARVKTGNKYIYIMPYGEDYECEGGHHVEILSQEEFDNLFSAVRLKNGVQIK